MSVFVAMLRGVNLARHNRIKMDALRRLCEGIGLQRCETHIQSGNMVFSTGPRDTADLSNEIADAIEKQFGFRPAVILRTREELKRTFENAPFTSRDGFDGARMLIYFLKTKISEEARQKLRAMEPTPEELEIGDCELFVYYPNGMARPKLQLAGIERTLNSPGTGRNWNTVKALLAMAERHV